VRRSQFASWGDFEDRTIPVETAGGCCPVQISVRGLNQRASRVETISAASFSAKAVESGPRPLGRDFEDRSTAEVIDAVGPP
jgi:hypothetical protein